VITRQSIGDLFTLAKGRKAPEVYSEKVPGAERYIQIEDLRSNNELKFANDPNGTPVVPDDICIAWDGANAGTVGYGLNGLIGSTIARLRPTEKIRVFTPYIAKYLQSKFKELNQATTGATIPHVSRDQLMGLSPVLPDYSEQRRIAAILDKADALRKKRLGAIQLSDDFQNSIYSTLVRSAQKDGAPVESLLDICSITTGKLDSNAADDDGEFPFFTCAQETARINTYAFDCEALLLAGNNANGDYSIKHYKGKFNAYQRTYVLALKNDQHSYGFFRYAIQSKLRDLKRMSKGTNTKYLTLGILAEQMLVVPDQASQQNFADVYLKVERQKLQMDRHLKMSGELYSSLATRAFSGQL
jgi:type I restriction enzyme S subunit